MPPPQITKFPSEAKNMNKSPKKKLSVRFNIPTFDDDASHTTSSSSSQTTIILSQSEIKNSWFSEAEMNRFKKSARLISAFFILNENQRAIEEERIKKWKDVHNLYHKHVKKVEDEARMDLQSYYYNNNNTNNNNVPQHHEIVSSEECDPRGLEQRISFERRMHSVLARRTVLDYQKKLKLYKQRQQQQKQQKQEQRQRYSLEDDLESKLAEISSRVTFWARENASLAGCADFKLVYPERQLDEVCANYMNVTEDTSSLPSSSMVPSEKRKYEDLSPAIVSSDEDSLDGEYGNESSSSSQVEFRCVRRKFR